MKKKYQPLVTYKQNMIGRDFIVGDIHGCYDRMMDELSKLEFDFLNDRMFSVGDLIDRGPKNPESLALIKESWFYPVRGNHEEMMIEFLMHRNMKGLRQWNGNGGNWFFDLPESEQDSIEAEYFPMLQDLPYAITIKTSGGDVGICHAEPPFSEDWNDVNDPTHDMKMDLIWGRFYVMHKKECNTKNILYTVHGHTPVKEQTRLGNAVFIDTGCVYSKDCSEERALTVIQIDGFPTEN